MSGMELHSLTSYCLLAVFLFFLFLPYSTRKGLGIWHDVDSHFVAVGNQLSRFLGISASDSGEASREAEALDRVFACRMALGGIVLLAIFPFHRLALTDGFIDLFWWPIQAIANGAKNVGADGVIHVAPDWREEEYYLWEIAAFLWTMFQLGSSQLREIEKILDYRFYPQKGAFKLGMSYLALMIFIALIGTFVLLIAVSLYVLVFEALVVFLFTVIEILLARTMYRHGRISHGNRGLESALFIEVPALLAFVLAAIFVGSIEGFSSYSSHWSHAFASGASALDLVLANVGLLMIRTFRRPYEGSRHGK
jgi:hypothetical protein